MKIIIDISKEDYKKAKRITVSLDGAMQIFTAIAEGKIIPENHGRLIDADALALEMRDIAPEPYFSPMWAVTQIDIEEAPTIIEAEKEEDTQ